MSETGRLPDYGTTRRIVSDFVLRCRKRIKGPVVEVGSARPKDAWWADFQQQLGMEDAEWVGVDIQKSDCTHHVLDLNERCLPMELIQRFESCLCCETLEHVWKPDAALWCIRNMLLPGRWVVITTPFGFPIHNFPDDFWRFTPECLRLLLQDAGFVDIETHALEERSFIHRDHLQTETPRCRFLPLWVGGLARTPTEEENGLCHSMNTDAWTVIKPS